MRNISWTDNQVKIFKLLNEGKSNKEIVDLGFDKSVISRVKKEIEVGGIPPGNKLTAAAAPPKPKVTGEEGEEILNVVSGFETEDTNLLFIFNPVTRKVRQFRHKYPDAVPMYLKCLEEPINFKGSFDEWLMSMVRSYLKAAGWEYAMVPEGQGHIYKEFLRLLTEGKIKLDFYTNGNPKLEVIHDNGQGRDGGKEGDKSTEARTGPPSDEVSSRAPKGRKRKPTKAN